MPSSVAVPSSVASSQPSNEWLTAVGYGCNDRKTQSGTFVKRYLQYYWTGGQTDYQCPGDSGGPVFKGLLGDGGAIVRVHSATQTDLFGTHDLGADAVAHRVHITNLVEAMEKDGVCYRAHVQNKGWMPAVCNGSVAGTVGESLRMEAIQIWSARPGVSLCYSAHLSNFGWEPEVCDGVMAGTTGQSRRIEALKVRVASAPTTTRVYTQAHVQDVGWQPGVFDGQIAGTTGQSKRMEAVKIQLVPGGGFQPSP